MGKVEQYIGESGKAFVRKRADESFAHLEPKDEMAIRTDLIEEANLEVEDVGKLEGGLLRKRAVASRAAC